MIDTISRQASLNTIIEDSIESRLRELHTCTPGIIESFDTDTQHAEIQPAVSRVLYDNKIVPLPKLIGCPLGILRTKNFAVTFPITIGDECILYFTERSLDAWLRFGDVRPPSDTNLHHIKDAYFLPLYTSETKTLSEYDAQNITIRNAENTQRITLKQDGNITMDTEGDITIIAGGDCMIKGKRIINNDDKAGVVTTQSINPLTGTPFPNGSTTLLNSDG